MTSLRIRSRGSAILAMLLLMLATNHALAQQQVDKLKGISKATVLVLFNATGSSPVGITESRLQTILELRLRSAGLRVLTEQEDANDPAVNPYMYLRFSTLETRNQAGARTGHAYRADLSARVFAFIAMNGSRAPAELWANSTMGVAAADQSSAHIEQIVNELTDSFLNAWLAANPKR